MLKVELENLLGYEIEYEDFVQLNKMYMNCDLDKYEFAKIVKPKRKEKKIEIVKVYNEDEYYVLVDVSIKKGKYKVRKLTPEDEETTKRLNKYGFMNSDYTVRWYQLEIVK